MSERVDFLINSCIFSTQEIWILIILMLFVNVKWEIFGLKFHILKNFLTRKNLRQAEISGRKGSCLCCLATTQRD